MYSIVIIVYIWRCLRRLSSTNRPWHWKKIQQESAFFILPHPPFAFDVHFSFFSRKRKKNQVFFITHTHTQYTKVILTRLWVVFYNKNTTRKKRERRKFTSFLVQVQGLDRCIGAACVHSFCYFICFISLSLTF